MLGIDYKDRLNVKTLIRNGYKESDTFFDDERSVYLLKGFEPCDVFDNERIFGVDHKNEFRYQSGEVWTPLFPYSNELLFESQEKVKMVSNNIYESSDLNLFELYLEHSDICDYYFNRLVNDDEYREILEKFTQPNSPIKLNHKQLEYFQFICGQKQDTFKKSFKNFSLIKYVL